MKTLMAMLVLCGVVGCGERDTSCAAVMKHLEKITPAEKRSEAFDSRRGPMMDRCAKELTTENRTCILDAKGPVRGSRVQADVTARSRKDLAPRS
jgi:hypothetical protein